MILLNRFGRIAMSVCLGGMIFLFTFMSGVETPEEGVLEISQFIGICTAAFTYLFLMIFHREEEWLKLRGNSDLITKLGELVAKHGSLDSAFSFLASSLHSEREEYYLLLGLHQRSDEQRTRLQELFATTQKNESEFRQFVAIAKGWGLKNPERLNLKDWIIVNDQPAPAREAAFEPGTAVTA